MLDYKTIKTIKNCREIKFSHGGQYFACQQASNVQVFKFYTAESPPEFFFHGHQNNIRCINWFEDDTGFITSGQDAGVSVWQLYPNRGEGTEAKISEAKQGMPTS